MSERSRKNFLAHMQKFIPIFVRQNRVDIPYGVR